MKLIEIVVKYCKIIRRDNLEFKTYENIKCMDNFWNNLYDIFFYGSVVATSMTVNYTICNDVYTNHFVLHIVPNIVTYRVMYTYFEMNDYNWRL